MSKTISLPRKMYKLLSELQTGQKLGLFVHHVPVGVHEFVGGPGTKPIKCSMIYENGRRNCPNGTPKGVSMIFTRR